MSATNPAANERYLVVSTDGHAGLLPEKYRDYLDPQHRERFDREIGAEVAARVAREKDFLIDEFNEKWRAGNGAKLAAAWDSDMRLEVIDADGVTAEVLFPDGITERNAPPFGAGLGLRPYGVDPELQWAGARAHNRWIAEFCAAAPVRRIGLAIVPMLYDVDAAVREVVWAHEHGLQGILIPALTGDHAPYNHPKYYPVWRACEERAVQLGLRFEPETSRRVFRVAMTDLHSVLTLPPLLRALERHAPGVRLQAEPISLPDLTERITDGEIDLALGFLLSPPERIRSETLFVDEYVCLVRRGHKLARRKRLTLADYGEHQHLSNTPVSFVPRTMADSRYGFGAREGIRASLPYLLALPAIVRSTDLVATAPRQLLEAPVSFDGVVVIDAPRELPKVEHCIWWHPRFDGDPAHTFLRELLREAAAAPACPAQ